MSWACRLSAAGISSGRRIRSAVPVSMALRGIPSNLDDASLWTITSPPASWMSRTPREPSLPVPDRMIPTAAAPRSPASERRNWSMGRLRPPPRSCSRRWPSEMIISVFAGIRYTQSRRTASPCSATRTARSVHRDRSSSIWLLKSGERCWTTTKAIPVSSGMPLNRCSSASRPPADAPMPTTWLGGASAAVASSELEGGTSSITASGTSFRDEWFGPQVLPGRGCAPPGGGGATPRAPRPGSPPRGRRSRRRPRRARGARSARRPGSGCRSPRAPT